MTGIRESDIIRILEDYLRKRKKIGTSELNLLKNPTLKQEAYPCIWSGKPSYLLKPLSPSATTFTSSDTRTELVAKRERLLKTEKERKKGETSWITPR